MYILYSVGVLLILCLVIDLVYVIYKKIIEHINAKSGRQREIKIPIGYMITFLCCALARIIILSKNVSFFVLFKESFLFGLLGLLVIFNVKTIKSRFNHAKTEISTFKNLEKKDGEKVFQSKKDNEKQ